MVEQDSAREAMESFDVCPFWNELFVMVEYAHKCITTGKCITKHRLMEYVYSAHTVLRSKVFETDEHKNEICRVDFWNGCEQFLGAVFDTDTQLPKRSATLKSFALALGCVETSTLDLPASYWWSFPKPYGGKILVVLPGGACVDRDYNNWISPGVVCVDRDYNNWC